MRILGRHCFLGCVLLSNRAGWCGLNDLLGVPKVVKFGAAKADIYRVVQECEKKRFEVKEEDFVEYIRATQGHSKGLIDTAAALTPLTSPTHFPVCIHCTKSELLPLIESTGLNRMGRQHIHMASREMGDNGLVSGEFCVCVCCRAGIHCTGRPRERLKGHGMELRCCMHGYCGDCSDIRYSIMQ